MRKGYVSHKRPAKAQAANLHIRAVSPEVASGKQHICSPIKACVFEESQSGKQHGLFILFYFFFRVLNEVTFPRYLRTKRLGTKHNYNNR